MLDATTAAELYQWQRYFSRNPWPWQRADDRAALMTANLANVQGAKVTAEACRVKYADGTEQAVSETEWMLWADSHNQVVEIEGSSL